MYEFSASQLMLRKLIELVELLEGGNQGTWCAIDFDLFHVKVVVNDIECLAGTPFQNNI